MSAGRKVLALGTAILAISVVGTVAATVVIRLFSETEWIGQVAMIIALSLGAALGLTLWFVVVRRLNLLSWDELDEYFGIEEDDAIDESGP